MSSNSSSYVVPELRREREASALNLQELTEFIYGGEMIAETRKKISNKIPCAKQPFQGSY